jgi:hypothetical protein
MNTKILLIAFSAIAFSSCNTAYKSGQTPDDVYYSPVRVVDESNDNNTQNEEYRSRPEQQYTAANDARLRMRIRDRRWRDFDYDYDYSYNYSPYHYCACNCYNQGYYYNPYYSPYPVYSPKITRYIAPVNSTPRMINLNSYKNYSNAVTYTNPKTGVTTTSVRPARQYNNSNNGSRVGNALREIFTPSSSSSRSDNNNYNNSSNNNTRTYTPSSSTNNSSNSSSSSSSSSGSSVSRPGKGG